MLKNLIHIQKKNILLFGFLIHSTTVLSESIRVPKKILGTYEKKHHVYFNCDQPPKNSKYCLRMETDRLTVKPLVDKKYRNIQVTFDSVGANGHTCSYEGTGNWSVNSKRLETDSGDGDTDEKSCKVIYIFHSNLVSTVVQDSENCSTFCGTRNSLDGNILKKKR